MGVVRSEPKFTACKSEACRPLRVILCEAFASSREISRHPYYSDDGNLFKNVTFPSKSRCNSWTIAFFAESTFSCFGLGV